MLSVQAAEAEIQALSIPLGQDDRSGETIVNTPLAQALGRILAQPITSPLDFPHWDNSAMDGYGVRFQDVAQASHDRPVILDLGDEIAAGQVPKQPLQPHTAARIFTGAMIPPGADTIVPQEQTQTLPQAGGKSRIQINQAPHQPGAFVRQKGGFSRVGDLLLPAGIALGPSDLAVLAAAQVTQVPLYRPLRVAVFSTGDELVPPGTPLQPGQIVDSNQIALVSVLQRQNFTVIPLGIVPDQPDRLRRTILSGLAQADVVISSGGVSVGDHDHIDRLLLDLGADLRIRSVAVKPGKPLTVARFAQSPGQLYVGLPGNPVSSLVSFWRFVQPALDKRSGLDPLPNYWVQGVSSRDLVSSGDRETYLWGRATWSSTGYQFTPAFGSHSSGNLINLSQTNALAQLPQGSTRIGAGDPVALWLVKGGH